MIVEMRTMRVKPGRRNDFLEIFHTRSMPAQAALGIRMLRPFLSVEDPDVFFFIRGFPDMASRDTTVSVTSRCARWTTLPAMWSARSEQLAQPSVQSGPIMK